MQSYLCISLEKASYLIHICFVQKAQFSSSYADMLNQLNSNWEAQIQQQHLFRVGPCSCNTWIWREPTVCPGMNFQGISQLLWPLFTKASKIFWTAGREGLVGQEKEQPTKEGGASTPLSSGPTLGSQIPGKLSSKKSNAVASGLSQDTDKEPSVLPRRILKILLRVWLRR